MNLTDYVKSQIAALIEGVEREAVRAETDTSEDGVHDLRVSIRRLSESLKVFADLFPAGAAQTVRSDLKVAMRLAGEVRNHDIAADLMAKAKVAVAPKMPEGRAQVAAELSSILNGWKQGVAFRAWKEQLYV